MSRIARSILSAALAATLLTTSRLPADPPATTGKAAEAKAQRDARMQWWRDAKFGMFIHWGVYSVPAGFYHGKPVGGIGEWIMCSGKIPMAEYQKFAKQFNPVKFNADDWVALAKEAGQKYMVITSKHHDGFAMFDSKASNWNIVKASPFHRDPLKELAAACRKQGVKLGFYYSQAQDWNNGGSECSGKWDPAQKHSMDDYIDKVAVPQVKELLTGYGEFPAVLWWDTACDMNDQRAARLAAVLKLKPGIITNNRLGGGFEGDTETPEQFIPPTGYPGRDWETCMTMNDTWGFKSDDQDWKPTAMLLHNLVDIVSKGGNYLLNVGPTSEGLIPAASVERLHQVGSWMKVNGEAIYGTKASPFPRGLPWGRATRKGDTIYLHVFDWPKDGKLVVPLANKSGKAHLLADKDKDLAVSSGVDGLTIQVPTGAPDKIVSVIALELDGTPQAFQYRVRPAADGSVLLKAAEAEIEGSAQVEDKGGEPNIGFWLDPKTTVFWNVDVPAGDYSVELSYAAENGSNGNQFDLVAGDQLLSASIQSTGAWGNFKVARLGKLSIPAGAKTITVRPTKTSGPVMNLRWIKLKKVR